MDWIALPKGFVLGVSVAAPVGPIGLLTIRRTITHGYRLGLSTGLGAATADATYGLIAAFGLTAIMSALVDHADAVRLLGGLFLLYLGARGLAHARKAVDASAPIADEPGALATYVQSVGLTLTNPLTILSFVAMFAGIGIVKAGADVVTSLALVAGVAAGSASWWFFLVGLMVAIRHRLSASAIAAINLISSGSILAFGGIALWTAR